MTELYPAGFEPKKPWQSRTLWVNLLIAGASFIPAVKEFVTPDIISTLFLVANTILRFTTKTGVTIK